MSTTTERVEAMALFLQKAREQDAAFAALEDRIEKATEMVQQLQVRLARAGWYEGAEACALILDVLNGVER